MGMNFDDIPFLWAVEKRALCLNLSGFQLVKEEEGGKESERQRRSGRDGEEDRLSELHDHILLHIMKFINTREAIPTCVLSRILTLSPRTLAAILNGLSNLVTMEIQPPCFVRLESFKMKRSQHSISDEKVNRVADYLLQNSPLTRVAVVKSYIPYSMRSYLGFNI
ncbi:hypothetical protein CR513_56905, partial [Mucuna pruriens]